MSSCPGGCRGMYRLVLLCLAHPHPRCRSAVVLGHVVVSWGVLSSPGPCHRILGGVMVCTGSCCGAWGLSPSPSLPPLPVLFGFPACSLRLLSSRHVSGTLGPPVVVPSSSTWALHLVSAVSLSLSAGRNRWVTWRVLNSG